MAYRRGGELNLDKSSYFGKFAIKSGLVREDATKITRKQKHQLNNAIHELARQHFENNESIVGYGKKNKHELKKLNPKKMSKFTKTH